MDISLPARLQTTPAKITKLITVVGATQPSPWPVWSATKARKATDHPRNALISHVCTQ
jgi:hypothetical protein